MLGSLNTGGAGADTLEVINRTGNAINSGDKVWINKSVTSEGSALVNTGGFVPSSCLISPDGSKILTGVFVNNNNNYCNIYDIQSINNINFIERVPSVNYNSKVVDISYTDAGNLTLSFRGNTPNRHTVFLKKDGTYNLFRFDSRNGNTHYLGENYWITDSGSLSLYTLNEDTWELSLAASGSWGYASSINGGYNTSTGYILGNSYYTTVSGSTISGSYNSYGTNIENQFGSRCFNTSSGYKVIGCNSYFTNGGYRGGQLVFKSWNGTTGLSEYDLTVVGLGYWKGKSVWPLYNPNTKILTVVHDLNSTYKVYRYDEQRNYFDEIVVQLNTAGNKFISPICFSDDMKRCVYSYLLPSESSITTYGANVKYMVEEIGASAKTIAVPYNFSNNYASTLTGVAETSGNNEETLMVRTVLPPKISVNVLADVNNMELVVR